MRTSTTPSSAKGTRARAAAHDGRRLPLGPAAPALGYVVEGEHTVYFAGDTDLFPAMSEVADNLRHLAGYEVCGIEVLRSDDALEIVGLATDDPHTRKAYDGASSPLSAMYPTLDLGTRTGLLTFIRAEEMTPEAFEQIRPYAITPDIAPTDDVTRWHADDMLVAQVVNDQDQLRSLVYFDVPRDGLRPTAARLRRPVPICWCR